MTSEDEEGAQLSQYLTSPGINSVLETLQDADILDKIIANN